MNPVTAVLAIVTAFFYLKNLNINPIAYILISPETGSHTHHLITSKSIGSLEELPTVMMKHIYDLANKRLIYKKGEISNNNLEKIRIEIKNDKAV